jgi:hypothetical protein
MHLILIALLFTFTLETKQLIASMRAQRMLAHANAILDAANQPEPNQGQLRQRIERIPQTLEAPQKQSQAASKLKQKKTPQDVNSVLDDQFLMQKIYSFLLPVDQAQLVQTRRSLRDQTRETRNAAAMLHATAFKPMHRDAKPIPFSKPTVVALEKACWRLGLPYSTYQPIVINQTLASQAASFIFQELRRNRINLTTYFCALLELDYLKNWASIVNHNTIQHDTEIVEYQPIVEAIANAQPDGATPGYLNLSGILDACLQNAQPDDLDAAFAWILKQVPNLINLNASHNPQFFNSDRITFLHSKLQILNISHNNMRSIHCYSLPSLQELDYSYNYELDIKLCFYGLRTFNISYITSNSTQSLRPHDFLCLFPCQTIIADGSLFIIDKLIKHKIAMPNLRNLSICTASYTQQARIKSKFASLAPNLRRIA